MNGSADAGVTVAKIARRATALGFAVRGAFCPERGELEGLLPGGYVGTIVLLGFTGSLQWPHFVRSVEGGDGLPNPLDRWSRRVIGGLANELGALDVYPSDIPYLPFQRWASRAESVHPSPLGLLIHPQWGLWHAYRGALVFAEPLEPPPVGSSVHPCTRCTAQPCLSACPVDAFRGGSFDVQTCVRHVESDAGADCRDYGCRARRACPVGVEFSYLGDQARFHLHAFLRSIRAEGIGDRAD